jgi:hypothetical protein
MKTAPPNLFKKGMIVFSKHDRVMAEVKGIREDDGINFWVINGAWNGSIYKDNDGNWEISRGGVNHESHPGPQAFEQVLSVTPEEYDQWYMSRQGNASNLINRAVPEKELEPPTQKAEADAYDKDPVFETKVVVTLSGQAGSKADFDALIGSLSLSDMEDEMSEGELVGTMATMVTSEIPPDQVRARLQELGNDGEFFNMDGEGYLDGDPLYDPSGRMLAAQIEQGWSNATMEKLGREFIDQAGLSHAFADFLEQRQSEENEIAQGFDEEPEF